MMMQDALPGVKRFLRKAEFTEQEKGFLVRLMTAFYHAPGSDVGESGLALMQPDRKEPI
jgi:hypothetical protein